MLNIIAKNAANQTLNLQTNNKYQLISATGINPPVANINTAQLATADGSVFNVARLPQRNIVLTIQPLYGIEKARNDLYKWFAPKMPVNLEAVTDFKDVLIDGYVESFECDLYANPQLVQVSVICPDPYFRAKSAVTDKTLPTSISNPGDVESGIIFTATMTGSASGLGIQNYANGVYHNFNMSGLTLQSGDIVTIDTRVGQKSVKLNRSGSVSSLIGKVNLASEWLQMYPGNNSFSVSLSNGTIKAAYTPLYMGV